MGWGGLRMSVTRQSKRAERGTEIAGIDRIELPGGVSPSGEATVADKAVYVCVCHMRRFWQVDFLGFSLHE